MTQQCSLPIAEPEAPTINLHCYIIPASLLHRSAPHQTTPPSNMNTLPSASSTTPRRHHAHPANIHPTNVPILKVLVRADRRLAPAPPCSPLRHRLSVRVAGRPRDGAEVRAPPAVSAEPKVAKNQTHFLSSFWGNGCGEGGGREHKVWLAVFALRRLRGSLWFLESETIGANDMAARQRNTYGESILYYIGYPTVNHCYLIK